MPVLGLGTWQLTKETAGSIEEALRLGYRMIDTSGDYGTQPGIGKAVRRSVVDRSSIYYTIEQVEQLISATGEAPVVNQIEWSPFGWSREVHFAMHERRLSPLR